MFCSCWSSARCDWQPASPGSAENGDKDRRYVHKEFITFDGLISALIAFTFCLIVIDCYSQKLLLFDGLSGTFRTVRLRGRRRDCAVCGENPTITELIDYPEFCGSCPSDKDRSVNILDHKDRMTSEVSVSHKR